MSDISSPCTDVEERLATINELHILAQSPCDQSLLPEKQSQSESAEEKVMITENGPVENQSASKSQSAETEERKSTESHNTEIKSQSAAGNPNHSEEGAPLEPSNGNLQMERGSSNQPQIIVEKTRSADCQLKEPTTPIFTAGNALYPLTVSITNYSYLHCR